MPKAAAHLPHIRLTGGRGVAPAPSTRALTVAPKPPGNHALSNRKGGGAPNTRRLAAFMGIAPLPQPKTLALQPECSAPNPAFQDHHKSGYGCFSGDMLLSLPS